MTINILQTLQYMKPDIKVFIATEIPLQTKYDAETGIVTTIEDPDFKYHVEINGYYIRYNETEDFRPTKEEILAIDQGLVEEYFNQSQ